MDVTGDEQTTESTQNSDPAENNGEPNTGPTAEEIIEPEGQPSTSNVTTESTDGTAPDAELGTERNILVASRVRTTGRVRLGFRRRHVVNHDGDLSTTTDSDDDTISDNSSPVREIETPIPNDRVGSSSTEMLAEHMNLIRDTYSTECSDNERDRSSTAERVTLAKYEEICNAKVKSNWFAINEIYKRQTGYNAKLNGHLQFQRKYYGSLHVAQRLELMSMMKYHDGCVNALGFNPTGNLLASSSDDLRVVIWDWAHSRRKISWVTRHRTNVFQCKFLSLSGQSELQLVTSARDGAVWLWQLGQDGLRGSRKLGHHRGASHKLSLVSDQPHVILSCGEDALVYSHDVRESKPTKLTFVINKEKTRVPLYSINCHPLISTEFCVSGHDQAAAVYDQRFINKDGTPMRRYEISQIKNTPDRHITASVYNYCGSELLVSYNDEDIYLFDTTEPEGSDFIHRYQGHRNEATIKGVNFFGPKSEYIISGSDCGNIFFWDKQSEGIVQFLLADKGVVNVLETHPAIPILASSGLDSDVKVWIPSREEPHEMPDLFQTVTGNIRIRSLNDINEDGDNRMIWMLWRVMQRVNRGSAHRRRMQVASRLDSDDNLGEDDDSSEHEEIVIDENGGEGNDDDDGDDDEDDDDIEAESSDYTTIGLSDSDDVNDNEGNGECFPS